MPTKDRSEPDPAVEAPLVGAASAAPGVSPEPEQVGQGRTLVRTRRGYEFRGNTVDVPITSTGVYVTKAQAEKIVAEAEANGEIVFIDETPEG